MIVLFLLMGTTFVVVANNYFKDANRRILLNAYTVDATTLLDESMLGVVRGVSLSDSSSPLRGHSILEDQYGHGYSAIATSGANGPIGSLKVINVNSDNTFREVRDDTVSFMFASDYADGIFSGCILSVVSGSAEGYSGRIVSSFWDGANNLQLVVPTDTNGINLNAINNGDRIIINGRDFTGIGAGNQIGGNVDFDDAAGLSPRLGEGILTPNRKGQSRADLVNGNAGLGIEPYIPFNNSTNEYYDLPDENNFFLSGEVGGDFIPSFHRDRHYAEGRSVIGTSAFDARGFSFRPLFIEDDINSSAQDAGAGNDSFFGRYNRMDGSLEVAINSDDGLDVDSDGDGENDAVWIDIGLPLQTDSQGRQFKPLVAYRIIDMDSRVNINVHGNYADSELNVAARRGSSFGVAEVTLGDVFGGADYRPLLDLRSGGDDVAGNTGNSLRAAQTLFGYVDHSLHTGNLFASAADVFGKNIVGRDVSVYGGDATMGYSNGGGAVGGYDTLTGSSTAIPYAANLGLGSGVGDDLFQAYEIEALLREDDIDSSLFETRLRGLGDLETNIDSITTNSAEIAMPPFSIVQRLWDESGNSLVDYRNLVSRGYLSEEMLMGGLFDLNQPTGNGLDDDGNGIVDDPNELLTAESSIQFGNPMFDLDNAGNGPLGDNLARQRKANQLYILALLVTGDTAPAFAGEFTTPINYRIAVAQWAVNIVDFIDADSIMTAFEVDLNPFNTTFIDGNPMTDDTAGGESFIVFGAERPELLITETFAGHDRRNRNLSSDDGDSDTAPGGDNDWDSSHIPESFVFIELYNPWTQLDAINASRLTNELGVTVDPANATQVPPAELYLNRTRVSPITTNTENYYGVNLQRTVPNTSGSGVTPVWRIGVKRDPDDASFLRAIFFADPSTAESDARIAGGENFFPGYQDPSGADVVPYVVEPNGYFVLGSSGNVTTGSEFTTTFGRPTSNIADVPMTRSIQLINTTDANAITINDPGGSTTTVPCGIAVVDQPRSLSFSDPAGGYEPIVATVAPLAVVTDEDDGRLITPALDTPLDARDGAGRTEADITDIWTNGVSNNFRTIYLQRLADPTRSFDRLSNPYITIDSAEVDLLAFNGLNNDPSNSETEESGETDVASGAVRTVTSSNTALVSSERGENRPTVGTARVAATHTGPARRTFFRTADIASGFVNADTGANNGSDNHNFSFGFTDPTAGNLISLGSRNNSVGGAAGSTEPLGELVWLNRPLANSMELVHVPIMPNGGIDAMPMGTLLDHFNRSRPIDDIPALTATSTPQDIFAYYFADDKFGHLMGFGGMSPAGNGAGEMNGGTTGPPARRMPTEANRFDLMFDFVSVPSKFQGLRTWLNPVDTASFTASANAPASGMIFNLRAPFHSLPSFREPGKMNLNTMTETNVYNAAVGGFTSKTTNFTDFRGLRDVNNSLTDFGGRFLPASRSQFVYDTPRVNAQAGLFRRDTTTPEERVFDRDVTGAGNENADSNSSSWYENEYRQRLGSVATTRSSVFSIWVTIGYFEVDQFGRVGREIGSDEGQVQRNRAFYMIDRSIPVACEPGRDHNVDKAILVRTIIE